MKKILFMFIAMIFTINVYANKEVSTLYLNDDVIDLRDLLLEKRGEDKIYKVMSELKEGDIFIDLDEKAKKVRAIVYDADGNKVIETSKPKIEEVIDGLYIPDQTLNLTAKDFIVAEGVTLTEKKGNIGNVNVGVSIDLGKLMGGKALSQQVKNNWKNRYADKASESNGSNKEEEAKKYDVSKSLTLNLNLDLENINVGAGVRLPSIKWEQRSRKVWFARVYWWVPVKRKGYINYRYNYDKKFTASLKGTIGLSKELSYPLIGIPAINLGVAKVKMGVYLKVALDGSLSLEVKFVDEEKFSAGASGDLDFAWTLFKVQNFRKWQSIRDKKKSIELNGTLEAEIRMGPSAELEITALGFTMVDFEIFLGLYANAQLYAKGVIELEPNRGETSFEAGGSFEAGIFAKAAGELIGGLVSFTIFDWKYPLYKKEWKFY